MQIQDLAKSYQTKTDEELRQLATNSEQLTSEAKSVLRSELARRKIDATEYAEAQAEKEHLGDNATSRGLSLPGYPRPIGELVEEVLRVYRGQFWFFMKLVAPAVVVGYIAVRMGHNAAWEIARHLPRDGRALLSHQTEFVEIWLSTSLGYLVSWIAFSFSFGAICFGVGQIRKGDTPSVPDSLTAVCHRLGSFLQLSLLLFFLILVAEGAGGLLSGGIFWILQYGHVHPGHIAIWALTFGIACLALLLMARFGLAVPALILDDYRVGKAMFRSDELTQGEWLSLAVLLGKSLIGGYLVGMCPFWLASFIPSTSRLPLWFPWILNVASITGVTVVEPMMFIGFALLYLRNAAPEVRQSTHIIDSRNIAITTMNRS